MLPGIEMMLCQGLAVPAEVMQHVVRVESSYNPYAIGVVGGHLVRQPQNLAEALATARMLESRNFNFSVGLAQVNRYNLKKYGLETYEKAFAVCPNLQAGSQILAECHERSGGDWGKSFSCYYSGNFVTGYRHGYVQKIYTSIRKQQTQSDPMLAIEVVSKAAPNKPSRRAPVAATIQTMIAPPPVAISSMRRIAMDATQPEATVMQLRKSGPPIAMRPIAQAVPMPASNVPQQTVALSAQASGTIETPALDKAFVF